MHGQCAEELVALPERASSVARVSLQVKAFAMDAVNEILRRGLAVAREKPQEATRLISMECMISTAPFATYSPRSGSPLSGATPYATRELLSFVRAKGASHDT
jgi:hypothetical protein